MALDFDGVISDSIKECLVTAFNAFSSQQGDSAFRTDISQFSSKDIQTFEQARSFIRRGEDYVYLLKAAAENVTIGSQTDFDTFASEHENLRSVYRELFYALRLKLQTEYLEKWLNLNDLYPYLETFLQKIHDPACIFIVTTKDLASVELILSAHGIGLRPDQLFQASKQHRKPQIINRIIDEFQIPSDQIAFIDDHADTVIEVSKNTDVTCYFAEWGYHSEVQLNQMLESHTRILTPGAFISRYMHLTDTDNQS